MKRHRLKPTNLLPVTCAEAYQSEILHVLALMWSIFVYSQTEHLSTGDEAIGTKLEA